MGFLQERRQDAQAAAAGFVIGQEAYKQGIDINESRRTILDKIIDLGYILQSLTGGR